MKIGFYTPYLHVMGGGEHYILQMASFLSQLHKVDVFGNPAFKEKAQKYLGVNLEKVNFIADIFNRHPDATSGRLQNFISKITLTKQYDRFFYVTDGSLFVSLAKKNFLVIQVPQKNMYASDLLTKLKLSFWQTKLVYSNYVKSYIDKWWGISSLVFPPFINTTEFNIGPKNNSILSVGRFFPLPHSKKQEILIDCFKNLHKKCLINWKLILAGGVDKQGKDYLQKVKEKAKGLPIEIYTNVNREKLLQLYAQAKIYWHATGFGEDLEEHPERAEHFGITTLEAMASGCVPLVYPCGGQTEIVSDKEDGLFWKSKKELIEITNRLINDSTQWDNLSANSVIKSQKYDNKNFETNLDKLIE